MVKKIKTDITVQRDNLSFAFIAEKSVVYEEPERKGTPRGEKIGFPKKKYLASLFVGISNFKAKDLAEGLQKHGLTHGLIRKWKTEDDFKKDGKWQASIGIRGRHVYLGFFDTEEMAVKAYNVAVADHGLKRSINKLERISA